MAIQPPSNDELATWDPASRLVALVERTRPRYERHGLESLNGAERTLLALFDFDSEICNGGFGQWLFNTQTDLIAITPECLERIGEEHMLPLVRSVLNELQLGALMLDSGKWLDYLQEQPEEFWHMVTDVDKSYVPFERRMLERLWSYAEAVARQVRLP
jgi:hypothetical protein